MYFQKPVMQVRFLSIRLQQTSLTKRKALPLCLFVVFIN
nr:MAG TPA: hypothetical protein [Caudoviricetes sp.]DAT22339.1 MAG TPA: hypothetical protein [Bacteriophage sp.]